jgi:glycerate 2-kinase
MNDLEKIARAIFFETLKSVDLQAIIRQRVRLDGDLLSVDEKVYDLSQVDEVILIGIGKASLRMGYAMEAILGERLTRGLLVTNRREPLRLRSEIIVAGHPVPDAQSLRAGKRAIEILYHGQPDSLVIFLISGGGSALFESPISDEITLEHLQQLNQILVECGATIEEINIIRKQFSAVKGGRLRKWMKAKTAVALLVSDVNAGDLKSLASNPVHPEEKTDEQFQAIINKYKLTDKLPSLFRYLSTRHHPVASESDEGKEPIIQTLLLAENADVVSAAASLAGSLGYMVWVDRSDNEDRYEKTATRLISAVAELKRANPEQKICVISGGEVSCPAKGQGFGGRNQEFVLHCAMRLKQASLGDLLVLSCGTDGIDGRSVADGAYAHIRASGSDLSEEERLTAYFQRSDTATWFNELGGMLVTGPTGNNLRDLRFILST